MQRSSNGFKVCILLKTPNEMYIIIQFYLITILQVIHRDF